MGGVHHAGYAGLIRSVFHAVRPVSRDLKKYGSGIRALSRRLGERVVRGPGTTGINSGSRRRGIRWAEPPELPCAMDGNPGRSGSHPEGRAGSLVDAPSTSVTEGLWEFPGGKVHDGETDFQALERELAEELELRTVSVGSVLFESPDPEAPFLIRFVEVEVDGDPTALEHAEIGWFDPSVLQDLPLAPSDARFVVQHLLAPRP